jgi:putative endonuclease
MKEGFTYIMSNYKRNVFYTGVTANLEDRVFDHKIGKGCWFTSHYKCYYLMWFEQSDSIVDAIAREKQIKNWHRDWKINLIREENPDMKDLAADWYDEEDLRMAREDDDVMT